MAQTDIIILADPERRKDERIQLRSFATFSDESVERHSIVIEDFSAAGFRFRSVSEFDLGAIIQLRDKLAGRRSARITWRRGKIHGCQLLGDDEQIPESVEDMLAGEDLTVLGEHTWIGWRRLSLFVGVSGLIWFGIFRAFV